MSNLWPSPGVLVRLSVAVLLFVLGIPTGWLLHTAVSTRREATAEPATRIIHAQSDDGWRFVNPLLECETAEAYFHQPALSLSKLRISAFVEEQLRIGTVAQASVYFRRLHDGPWFGINERVSYAPASILKIPILLAVLKRAEHEPGLLQRQLTFDDPDDLNRLMRYRPAVTLRRGRSYTVEELCRQMVAVSDNNAQRLLVQFVGEEQVDRVLGTLGILPELERSGGDLSIKTLSSFFRILYNASFLSEEMSEFALEMLSHSTFRDGILAGIPADVPASSKYGEAWVSDDRHQLHEFAIIYHRDHPYLLGVLTSGRDFEELKTFIRELSRMVYSNVNAATHPAEPFPRAPNREAAFQRRLPPGDDGTPSESN